MHETSIVLSLLDIVAGECRKSGYSRVDSVNIRIGRASGIMPDALLFAFDALKGDTPAKDSSLCIEEVPVSGHCEDCSSCFVAEEEYVLCCPACKGAHFRITAGRELDIIDIEVS